MAVALNIHCNNEVHHLTLNDDGTVTPDPETHDVELERSLAELGADLPPCVLHQESYKENLFLALRNHAITFIPGYYETGTRYYSIDEDLTALVLTDYVDHIAYAVGNKTMKRRNFDSMTRMLRELYRHQIHISLKADTPHHDATTRALQKHIEEGAQKIREQLEDPMFPDSAGFEWEHKALAAMQLLAGMTRRRDFERPGIDDCASLCRRAAAAYAVRSSGGYFEHGAALERENQWQRRHLVAVMTAFVNGGPWPTVAHGGS